MSKAKLQRLFPHLKTPIICNGPMRGAACPALAVEVAKAGGIGFDGCMADISKGSADLKALDANLRECRERLSPELVGPDSRLPIGVGFVTGHKSIPAFTETVLPILAEHRPAAAWLFAPDETVKPHKTIVQALRGLEFPPLVFVQVGNVRAAREAAQDDVDVIVCQGIDAGGHQFRQGMGVVSLIPSVRKMLREEFPDKDIAILGAGGLVTGESVAAVLTLGAIGGVLGTRFTVADESIYPAHRKELVLQTKDGGVETFKSAFNDQINNNTLWGPLYDGRAIIGPVHEKFMSGASLEECQQSLKTDYSPEDATKIISTWAGTGVGLIDKKQPAGEIVREVRDGTVEVIKRLTGVFS